MHTGTAARILCIPDPVLCMFPGFHNPGLRFLISQQVHQEQYPEAPVPCNKHIRQQPLLLRSLLPDLHKDRCWTAVSKV